MSSFVYDYNLRGVGLAPGIYGDLSLASQTFISPAAGADFTITVPDTGGVWEIVALRAQLVTSATVANRGVVVQVKDHAANIVYESPASLAITASLTIGVTFSAQYPSGVGDITTTKKVGLALPDGPYLPGWTVGTSTALIDTADQWSLIRAWYRQLQTVSNEGLNGG